MCWQWRYERSCDDLLKTTDQKLNELYRLKKNGATLKFSSSRMSIHTICPEFYEISVRFFPPIFQFSTSLEQAFFFGNYNAFATCFSDFSEECQNARAVFNPAGCISTPWRINPGLVSG